MNQSRSSFAAAIIIAVAIVAATEQFEEIVSKTAQRSGDAATGGADTHGTSTGVREYGRGWLLASGLVITIAAWM